MPKSSLAALRIVASSQPSLSFGERAGRFPFFLLVRVGASNVVTLTEQRLVW